jgi:hypothetical protein
MRQGRSRNRQTRADVGWRNRFIAYRVAEKEQLVCIDVVNVKIGFKMVGSGVLVVIRIHEE